MRKIKLKEAILMIKPENNAKGWEYLGRYNSTNYYWLPSSMIVNEFRYVIGNKWNLGKITKTSHDLLSTNIKIEGKYVMASGGLCPGRVRLFDVVDLLEDDIFSNETIKELIHGTSKIE